MAEHALLIATLLVATPLVAPLNLLRMATVWGPLQFIFMGTSRRSRGDKKVGGENIRARIASTAVKKISKKTAAG